MDPGARPYVDQKVAGVNGVLIVLDHNDGITEVAQIDECFYKSLVVALVEPNGRLVQDIQRTHKPRAKLAREPDALCLAAGERIGAAVEG